MKFVHIHETVNDLCWRVNLVATSNGLTRQLQSQNSHLQLAISIGWKAAPALATTTAKNLIGFELNTPKLGLMLDYFYYYFFWAANIKIATNKFHTKL